jgi:acetolactate synthase small subunit
LLDRSMKVAEKQNESNVNEGEVIDLGAKESESESNFGFLGGLASAGDTDNVTDNLRAARSRNASSQELKLKIEDIEYKLDRFIERLEKLEGKFGD